MSDRLSCRRWRRALVDDELCDRCRVRREVKRERRAHAYLARLLPETNVVNRVKRDRARTRRETKREQTRATRKASR